MTLINSKSSPFLHRGCEGTPDAATRGEGCFSHGACKLDVQDRFLRMPIPDGQPDYPYVEIRFKNSRKDFFQKPDDLILMAGDIVAVESSPGHDIGIVSLTGHSVEQQMAKKAFFPNQETKKVYRKARVNDIEKWIYAVMKENDTLFRTRKIIYDLNLEMKLNDVEYQGDGTKAIFYYTADDRVDFRQLIKLLAEQFRIRIEMKQIGVRQEAARMGGIGSCGRELCCVTWLTQFRSVTTATARIQQLSLNPQKLAGQCSKLKCCLNYEYEVYQEALREFPQPDLVLQTKYGNAEYMKADVFKRLVWYSYINDNSNMMAIPLKEVNEIISMNKKGVKPDKLEDFAYSKEQKTEFEVGISEEDLRRFDD
ncbi:MAG: hypothetical protein EOL88_11725 [Bacteroidia bacterium]|nr:hypothetical protein [Bacteroidia bacterium]